MHKPELGQDETRKVLWNFEIQTVHLISARRPDQVIINKKRERSGRPLEDNKRKQNER